MYKIGDQVSYAPESTGAAKAEILVSGLTVEINVDARVPCYLARNIRSGKEQVLMINSFGRLVSAHHRTIRQCREIETPDGELVSGELKARIDAALAAP